MLIIGHPFLDFTPLYHIESLGAIDKTPSNAPLLITFSEKNLDLINFSRNNHLQFGVAVHNLKELLLAKSLGAHYILPPQDLLQEAQKIAENYLFDAKILAKIEEEENITEYAKMGIDGVIFYDAIIQISS